MVWIITTVLNILTMVFVKISYAQITAEEGKEIFDVLFYPMLGWFGICFMIGLFIKIINRS